MNKALLRYLLVVAALPAYADVVCTGTSASCSGGSSGTVASPVATDPLSFTGVVTFNNAANTPVTASDGIKIGTLVAGRVTFAGAAGLLSDDADFTFATDTATATNLVGSTSSCGGAALGAANSVCLGVNTITFENAADAFEFFLVGGNSTADQTLTCTGAASSLGCVVDSPAVPTDGTTAGNSLALTASPAIPNTGAGTNGAAAGGSITLTGGNAARDTSGDANGGNITITPGAGIGTGTTGVVDIGGSTTAPRLIFGTAGTGFGTKNATQLSIFANSTEIANVLSQIVRLNSGVAFGWTNSATNASVAADAGLARSAAGVLKVTNGTTGGGDLIIGTGILTASTMTAELTSLSKTVTSSYTWTNAQVVALGAALTGDINVATLPAKTQVLDAMVVITGQGAGTTTLTVSCGDAIGATPFINYVVPSDAKAAVNTVYGDAVAERGTSIDTEFWYLPSYVATTLVTCHFIATGANLDQVTGSTGRVILTTRLLP